MYFIYTLKKMFTGTTEKHKLKNILFLSAKEIQVNPGFPSGELGFILTQ